MNKTLVYVCGDVQLKDRALNYLSTTREEVITIQSNIQTDLQPFGSVVKSILVSAYKEYVTDIYIVVSTVEQIEINESDVRGWLESEGIGKEKFEIFDYLDQFSKNTLHDWLAVNSVEKTLSKNLDMLKTHPFLPKKLNFNGLLLEENGEFKLV